ncbi:PLP-dependent aminotransferase family protein [Companilactobacillus ginsenosidimutans]|uniref:HTH gntR-type domain-containing protein n=1 Tax=Companilactobacillus ginsenosidimutans TaxID=1007676 RepID=A0A0H4R0U8_9LACO|nr:PLP-dependent aminotransferase family protein [Companilactobacillus ginsenosidimutans]AKP67350.1 hypothetical protein ABM34_07220 [Companilactobacillus ginsenosidimutans]
MFHINRDSHEQIYLQLYRQLRAEIETGVRLPTQAVPSTRFLAKSLSVSRNTVDHAFQDLVAEGYLESRPGAGYHVATHLPIFSAQSNITDQEPLQEKFIYDFTDDYDRMTLFPKRAWLDAEQSMMLGGLTHIQPANGDLQYREQLVNYLARLKNIDVDADQIVVTNGFNEAAGIIANLIPNLAENKIAVANPIAPNASGIWNRLGVDVIDFDDIDCLPEASAYVICPTHNFPDGHGLDNDERQTFSKWLIKNNRYLIELDTDGTLIYDGNQTPAIHHFLDGRKSFYYTNYDDTLGSALCMGILVLPKELLPIYKEKYGKLPNRNSLWQQQILSRMIANDSLERYIRQLTIVYRNRRELLIASLKKSLGSKIEFTGTNTGTFIVAKLQTDQSISKLIRSASEVGVGIVNPDRCWHNQPKDDKSIIMSFRQVDDDKIIDGVKALAEVWDQLL